jgi:translation elongation factor EF-G
LNAYALPEEESKKWFWEKAPLHEVILDMAIKHLPNPLEAQKYRIPKIWHGDRETDFGKGMMNTDPNAKLSFCITRVMIILDLEEKLQQEDYIPEQSEKECKYIIATQSRLRESRTFTCILEQKQSHLHQFLQETFLQLLVSWAMQRHDFRRRRRTI